MRDKIDHQDSMVIVASRATEPCGYGETTVMHRINLLGLVLHDKQWDCSGNGDHLSCDVLHKLFREMHLDFLMCAVEVCRHWCRSVLTFVLVVQQPMLGQEPSWAAAVDSTTLIVSQRDHWNKMKMSKETATYGQRSRRLGMEFEEVKVSGCRMAPLFVQVNLTV